MTIVSDIRERGYSAVSEWAVKLDGVEPARAEPEATDLPVDALLALADRVRRWHEAQRPADITLEVEPGVVLERRWVPLDTVGVYIPRNLISTLVMTVVPAQVVGVRRIIVCTPPSGAGMIAAAAELLGVRRSAGDRLHGVRRAGRQARRARQLLRERREARGVARRSYRLAWRAFRGRRAGAGRFRPAAG
jgi:hypothetical protein